MFGADTKCKATVRPRTIQVKASVLTAQIMADPVSIRVNVRSLRMPRPVGTSMALRSGVRLSSGWRRTMLRNVIAATMLIAPMLIVPALCKSTGRERQRDRQKPYSSVHVYLRRESGTR